MGLQNLRLILSTIRISQVLFCGTCLVMMHVRFTAHGTPLLGRCLD